MNDKSPNVASILDMAQGAIKERVDYEMKSIIGNIRDVNTEAKKPRKLTLTLTLTPDSERQHIGIGVQAKTTLQPTSPVETSLFITDDGNAYEMVPQIPGQRNIYGGEQEEPPMLKVHNGGLFGT